VAGSVAVMALSPLHLEPQHVPRAPTADDLLGQLPGGRREPALDRLPDPYTVRWHPSWAQ
jgi:hypothetical protein